MYTYNHPTWSIGVYICQATKGSPDFIIHTQKLQGGRKKNTQKPKKKIKNQKNLRSCLLTQLEKNCKRKSRKIRFLE